MHYPTASIALLIAALVLGSCAIAPPSGPSVMALPAEGKTFENWVRRYAEKKLAGETASIESEELEGA